MSSSFLVVWLAQSAALIGSGLTSFMLSIWLYRHTGSVGRFGLLLFFSMVPTILVQPFAGVLADRFDRRLVMILGAGLSTLATLALWLLLPDALQADQVYWLVTPIAVGGALLELAYRTAIPLLVSERQRGRANGLVQLGSAGARVLGPLLGGILIEGGHLRRVVGIDLGAGVLLLAVLQFVRFPSVARPPGSWALPVLWHEITHGARFIWRHTGLLFLLALMTAFNFAVGLVEVLFTPMVLGISTADRLGAMLSLGGVAMIAGSVGISLWGGPRRQVRAVLFFLLVAAVSVAAAGVRPTLSSWTVALCCFFCSVPFLSACSESIWQAQVPLTDQGRVFATRGMISLSGLPLAFLLAPALTGAVFEPLVAGGAPWQEHLRWLLGAAAVHGAGLAFLATGLTILVALLFALRAPSLAALDHHSAGMPAELLPDRGAGDTLAPALLSPNAKRPA